ncbi:MAG: DUF5675 family protein [Amphiplicatus sp.]
MQIIVDRYHSTNEATLSRVSVDGAFFCYGLEDEARAVKVAGETRIPGGSYHVALRTFGVHHDRYKRDRRFRDVHEGTLWIKDVPGFEHILIHPGNTERDTQGCLLVGMERDELRMTIGRSGEAYRGLYIKVKDAAKAGKLLIDFQDNDL